MARIWQIAIGLALASAAAFPQGSDLEVTKDVGQQFVKSKGASLVGRDIHWHVPAKAFVTARRTKNGHCLFVSQGIGIITVAYSSEVEEVVRRGGVACVRGHVLPVPTSDRTPGDPSYVVVVRSLAHRRH